MGIDIAKKETDLTGLIHVVHGRMARRKFPEKTGRYSDGLILILRGSCRYLFSDGVDFVAAEGQILFLARGSVYSMEILDDCYEVLYADFFFVPEKPRQSAVYTPHAREKVENLFYRMLETYLLHRNGFYADCMSLLWRVYGIMVVSTESAYLGSETRKKMEAAQEHIRSHFADEGLNVRSLARNAGMSEAYFRRLFRQYAHTTPVRFIQEVRLARAKELLLDPHPSLGDIAAATGFSEVSYLCRVFKSETGMTPMTFRAIRIASEEEARNAPGTVPRSIVKSEVHPALDRV